jgi:hypothetical protein
MSETQPQNVAFPGLFRATYYVDPMFTGLQLGSESNPFTTCAAAFTAMTTLSLTVGLILLSPGCNLTENVVFPTTGNDWEIACLKGAVGTVSATITGTVTANPVGTVRYRLTELFVTGAISGGVNGGSSQLILTRVRAGSTVTTTGGAWNLQFNGRGPANLNSFNGTVVGAVSCVGVIFAQNYVFQAAVSWNANPALFDFCRFNNGSLTGATPNVQATFTDCEFAAALTLTDSSFVFDGYSREKAGAVTLAGAATVSVKNAVIPYKATFYVDPTFTGTQLGSASNPYATIAAAFAAGALLGITSGAIFLAPGTTATENVVFPATGSWQIICQAYSYSSQATINGTVTFDCTGLINHALQNLTVSGAVSGVNNSATDGSVAFIGVQATSTVSFTQGSTGAWRILCNGYGFSFPTGNVGGSFGSTCFVAGIIDAFSWSFLGAVSGLIASGLNASVFCLCTIQANITVATAGGFSVCSFIGCWFNIVAVVLTCSSGFLLWLSDGYSNWWLNANGYSIAGAGTSFVNNAIGSRSSRTTVANNVGLTGLLQPGTSKLCRVDGTLTLLAAGTLGAAVTINAIYRDLNNVVQTRPLLGPTGVAMALNITSAVGTEVSGSLTFTTKDASGVSFSVTGVTTPGALSMSVGVVATQLN